MEGILDVLGNETRREILQLLSVRPCYVSQLAHELNVGQKAIIEHLQLMHEAGILEVRLQRVEKGRPRKYYLISTNLRLNVRIGQDTFQVETLTPRGGEKVLAAYPGLGRLTEAFERVMASDEEKRIEGLELILEEVHAEERKFYGAKRVVEYLVKQALYELRRERELYP